MKKKKIHKKLQFDSPQTSLADMNGKGSSPTDSATHFSNFMDKNGSINTDNGNTIPNSPTTTTTTTTATSETNSNNNDDNIPENQPQEDVEMEEEEEEELVQAVVDEKRAAGIVRELVTKTEKFSVEDLVEVYARVYACLHRHHEQADKSPLLQVCSVDCFPIRIYS